MQIWVCQKDPSICRGLFKLLRLSQPSAPINMPTITVPIQSWCRQSCTTSRPWLSCPRCSGEACWRSCSLTGTAWPKSSLAWIPCCYFTETFLEPCRTADRLQPNQRTPEITSSIRLETFCFSRLVKDAYAHINIQIHMYIYILSVMAVFFSVFWWKCREDETVVWRVLQPSHWGCKCLQRAAATEQKAPKLCQSKLQKPALFCFFREVNMSTEKGFSFWCLPSCSQQQSNNSLVRRREVPEFILLVTQRITKYPVLLERILQYTQGMSLRLRP